MAYGDIGSTVTELVLTCSTIADGPVDINKGDAVRLVGDYIVDNMAKGGEPVFGQALADSMTNSEAIPVKVRGVCALRYSGGNPKVDGSMGVEMFGPVGDGGAVRASYLSKARGINLRVDRAEQTVDVLL